MSGNVIFVAQTPIPALPTVSLSEQRWLAHIVRQHTYMVGREKQVEQVVTNATAAFVGSNTLGSANPNYIIVINSQIISQSGSPLGVVVDPVSGEIRTAYYNRSLKAIDRSRLLWQR